MSGQQKKTFPSKGTLRALLLSLINEWDPADNEGKKATQSNLVSKIIDLKNQGDERAFFEEGSIQPGASRELKWLTEHHMILKSGNRRNAEYTVYTIQDARKLLRPKMCEEIKVTREAIFVVSSTVVVIPVSPSYLTRAKELFLQYISDDNCYDAIEMNGYLALLLQSKMSLAKDKKAELTTLRDDLKELVKDIYQFHQPKLTQIKLKYMPEEKQAQKQAEI